MTSYRGWDPICSFLQTCLIIDSPINRYYLFFIFLFLNFFAKHLSLYVELLLYWIWLETAAIEDSKWLTKDQESLCIFVSFCIFGRRDVSPPAIMKRLNGTQHGMQSPMDLIKINKCYLILKKPHLIPIRRTISQANFHITI